MSIHIQRCWWHVIQRVTAPAGEATAVASCSSSSLLPVEPRIAPCDERPAQ